MRIPARRGAARRRRTRALGTCGVSWARPEWRQVLLLLLLLLLLLQQRKGALVFLKLLLRRKVRHLLRLTHEHWRTERRVGGRYVR